MKKFILFGVIAISISSLLGCPHTDPPPDPPEEKVAHIDYPDWNENKVDDREETLKPKDRVELFSILDYQEKYEDKGWMAKVVDVSSVDVSGDLDYPKMVAEGGIEETNSIPFFFLACADFLNTTHEDGKVEDWALVFNQDVSNWDVSQITDMTLTLGWIHNFNQDISNWDVSNVTNMVGMFAEDESFNQDLRWADKIGKVEDFSYMFFSTSMDQNLSSWDVTGKPTTGIFAYTPMEYKPNQHPQGCKCGASSSNQYNPYPTEYGTWSHVAE